VQHAPQGRAAAPSFGELGGLILDCILDGLLHIKRSTRLHKVLVLKQLDNIRMLHFAEWFVNRTAGIETLIRKVGMLRD
jgi:hypothetical protein